MNVLRGVLMRPKVRAEGPCHEAALMECLICGRLSWGDPHHAPRCPFDKGRLVVR